MRFVTHHLQQLQRRFVTIQTNGLFAIGNVNLFFAFCESRNGDAFDPQPIERGQGGVELSSPAVDEDHVGQRTLFLQQSPIASIDGLGHRPEIVGARDAADIEDAVLILVEFSAVEHDHARHRIAPLNIRYVEGFDAVDFAGVPKSLCKSCSGDLQPVLLRFPEPRLVRETRVAVGQLDAVDAAPPLRHAQSDFASARLGEPLAEELRLFHFEGQQNLGWNEEIVLVVTLHHFAEEVAGLVVADFFPEQLATIDNIAVADDEELHRNVAALFVQAPHVDVLFFRRRHLLLRLDALDGPDQVAVVTRDFVILRFRGVIHALGEPPLQLLRLAAEKEHDVIHHLAVRVARGEADNTRTETLVHVVVKTRTRQRAPAVDDLEIATAQLELIGNQLEQTPRGSGEKRSIEKVALLAIDTPRENDARKIFGHRDLEVRVGLVVAKEDVVARLMRFDQIVLEHDRLELVVGRDEIDSVDLLHQRGSERIAIALAHHVRAGTVAQIPRLPDVDHLSLGVLVQIDAGTIGKLLDSRFQAREAIWHRSRKREAASRNSSLHSWPPSYTQVVTRVMVRKNFKSFSNFSAVYQSSRAPRATRTGGTLSTTSGGTSPPMAISPAARPKSAAAR